MDPSGGKFVLCSHAYCTTVQRLLLSARHSYKCSPTTLTDHKDQQGLKKPIWAKPDGSFASRFCYRAKPHGQDATRFCYPWQLDDPKGQEGARGAKPDGPFASRFCNRKEIHTLGMSPFLNVNDVLEEELLPKLAAKSAQRRRVLATTLASTVVRPG